MSVSTLRLQTDIQAIRDDVDDLRIVVNGSEAKDVIGLRKRMTAVERLAEELSEARSREMERWKWLSRGIVLGLSITSMASLLAALPQLLALFHGVIP
jgi:mevalonate pyrophosphate decarboxylase